MTTSAGVCGARNGRGTSQFTATSASIILPGLITLVIQSRNPFRGTPRLGGITLVDQSFHFRLCSSFYCCRWWYGRRQGNKAATVGFESQQLQPYLSGN